MKAIYFDMIFVLVLLLFFIRYYKRGLLSALVNAGGFLLSALCGYYVSDKYAETIYQSLVEKKLIEYVEGLLENMKDGVEVSISGNFIGNAISEAADKIGIATDLTATAETIVSSGVDDACISLIKAVLFVLVLILSGIVIRAIARLLKGVNKVPIVGAVNGLLGGVVGVAEGLLVLLLAACVISLLVKCGTLSINLQTEIKNSYLFSKIYMLNPFYD